MQAEVLESQKYWRVTSLWSESNLLLPPIGIGLTNLPKYAGAHKFRRSCFCKLILFQSRGRLCPFHRHLPNLILKCFAGPATAIFVSELWFLITQSQLKVSKFQNKFMKSSFLPKYEQKLSGFLPCVVRAEILTIFHSYFGRNDDFRNSFRNLLTFSKCKTIRSILPNYDIFESINAVSVCNIVTMIFMILDILSNNIT